MAIGDWDQRRLMRFWITCWVLAAAAATLVVVLPIALVWEDFWLLIAMAVLGYGSMAMFVFGLVAPLVVAWRWYRLREPGRKGTGP